MKNFSNQKVGGARPHLAPRAPTALFILLSYKIEVSDFSLYVLLS